ncbi:hypothetical protein [Amycolatopsis sp. lyj-109]
MAVKVATAAGGPVSETAAAGGVTVRKKEVRQAWEPEQEQEQERQRK